MAQRESIMDLINRLGVEKPDPRLRMDPYNYPVPWSEGTVAQFGGALQDMGQRLESSLQAEDELGRFAELIPRWLAANPAKRIGAVLQDPEGAIQQLRGMAEGAIEDPVGTAQSLGQAGIEAVQDPLGTAEQMSALEMLGGGKALSSIAKRLGRRDVGVTDEPMPDVQPTRKGQLSQQLYEQAIARGEVPGEAVLAQFGKQFNIDERDLALYTLGLNLPDVEKARLDRAVKQGFNIDAFHGTAGDITDFDPGLLGKTTDAPSARKAFFFSADTETANSYAAFADAVELGRTTPHELGAMLRPHVDKLAQLGDRHSDRQIKVAQDVDAQSGGIKQPASIKAMVDKAWQNDPELQALQKEIDNLQLKINTQYQSVMPVKLRMTNPLVHDFKGEAYREVSYHDLLQTAKDKGHDGVIMKNTTDGGPITDIYAVFEPHQIRSQYATFDPERAPREVGDRPYAGKEREDKIRELQDEIEFTKNSFRREHEKAKKDLAALLKDELRTPKRTAGPTYVLAEAAFPLGGITAAIAYDVNQRGDR
jgi:hypothetical protein